KGAHVRAHGCASSRRRALGEKRRAVEPTGCWLDRHAGAMVLATFAETKVARSRQRAEPGFLAKRSKWIPAFAGMTILKKSQESSTSRLPREQKNGRSAESAR